jgi:hypothetical protein
MELLNRIENSIDKAQLEEALSIIDNGNIVMKFK